MILPRRIEIGLDKSYESGIVPHMMTKKHFEEIAAVLRVARDGSDDAFHTTSFIAEKLADVFEQENPRFDRERFINATF